MVARRTVVASSVCADFLVSHHHAGDRLVVQLVDPVSRLRVDVFQDRSGAVTTARVGVLGWRVVEAAVMLDHKLEILAKASPAVPVDPKHAADARALAARLGRPEPSIEPAALRADVHATDLGISCARCAAAADPAFPLAPKAEIFAILGYV